MTATPRVIHGITVPHGVHLPIVVTRGWLAAMVAAGWACQCQRDYRAGACTHVSACDHGSGYPLVLDAAGLLLCPACAQARTRIAARAERAVRAFIAERDQTSIFDLLTETES